MQTLLQRSMADNAVPLTEDEIEEVVGGQYTDGTTIKDQWMCWSEELGSSWLEARIFD